MNSVQKFIEAARSYRMDEQMQQLKKVNFFTMKELRDGLKRKIHLKYIECV